MDLDRREGGDLQRVADRPRVMRPRSRVEHDGVGVLAQRVQALDECALVIALKEARREVQLAGFALDPLLELGKRERAVQRRVAATELVEVHAVHDLDARPRAHAASSATAARTSSAASWHPTSTSPGAATSTNGTSPERRFLSRASASSTASTVAPSNFTGRPRPRSSSSTVSRRPCCPERRSAASSPSPTASPWR